MSSPCDLSSHNLLLTKPEQIDGRRRRRGLRGLVPGNEVEKIVVVEKPSFDYLGDSSKESRAAIEEKGSGASTEHEDKEGPEEKVFLSYILMYGLGDANCEAPAIDQEEMEDMEEMEKEVQAEKALDIKKALDAAVKKEDKNDEVFSEQDKTDVGSYLSEGCADICLNTFLLYTQHRRSWETATLKISRDCFQVKIGEEFLIDDSFTAKYEERNKIVLALKAFRELNVVSTSVPEVCWTKPPIGYLKLNTAGIKHDGTEYAIGGLIRDELGGWVRGFWGKVQLTDGPFNMIIIKLMALEKGFSLAVELDPQAKYLIESSFVLELQLLDPENRAALSENLVNQCNNSVTKCRLLLDDLPNCELRIIGMQGNEAACILAFVARKMREFGVEKLDDPPADEDVIMFLEMERTAVPSNKQLQVIEDFMPVMASDSETGYPVRAPVLASKQMKVHPSVDFMDYLRKKR